MRFYYSLDEKYMQLYKKYFLIYNIQIASNSYQKIGRKYQKNYIAEFSIKFQNKAYFKNINEKSLYAKASKVYS